jgi:hypothetical protein
LSAQEPDWTELLDEPPPALQTPSPPAQAAPWVMLIIAPGTLLLSALMLYVGLFYWRQMFFTFVTVILLIPLLWTIISALRPALPDRKCPRCGADALVLIDPQIEFGIRCLQCPHVDREKRIYYLKQVMNDPEIAAAAGFIIDDFGEARLPKQE